MHLCFPVGLLVRSPGLETTGAALFLSQVLTHNNSYPSLCPQFLNFSDLVLAAFALIFHLMSAFDEAV